MLGIEELLELEQDLREALENRLEEIISRLNRTGELYDLLRLLGLTELLGAAMEKDQPKDGKIIVIGQSEVSKEILAGIAKRLGFEKNRFEFYLEYEDGAKYDFKKMQYSRLYSCVLVGAMPHSGLAKTGFGSIIAALEQEPGYPPVYRLGLKDLKITKSSFGEALNKLLQSGVLAA